MNYFCIIFSFVFLFLNSSLFAVNISEKTPYYSEDKFSINRNLVDRLGVDQIETDMLEMLLQLMLQAQQYFELGLFQDAFDSFSQLNKMSPNNSQVLYYMAISKKKLGSLDEAKIYFNLAVKYDFEFNQFDYVFYPGSNKSEKLSKELDAQIKANVSNLTKFSKDKDAFINKSDVNSELNKFWFRDNSLKLEKMKYLIKNKNFDSNREITREDFIKYAYAFFDFKSIDSDMMKFSNNTKLFKEKSDVNKFINTNKKILESYSAQSMIQIYDLKKSDDSFLFIQSLLKKGVFWLFRANYYFPDRKIKRIDAIVIIVRYLNFKNELLLNSNIKLPYKDIKRSYWGRKYIEFAYQNDLIGNENKFYPDRVITKSELISLFLKVPSVAQTMSGYVDEIDNSRTLSTDNAINETTIDDFIEKEIVKKETLSSKNISIKTDQNTIQEGTVLDVRNEYNSKNIEKTKILSDSLLLDSDLNLDSSGKDLISIQDPIFKDLDNHWFKVTALQLQQMNYLEAKELFEPKKIMTRKDFLNHISKFFDLENLNSDLIKVSNNTTFFKENSKVNRFIKANKKEFFSDDASSILIRDVNIDDPDYLFLERLLKTGSFWLFSDNYFYPKNKMKRIDVIVVIVRYLNFKNELILNSNVKFPFKDISKSFWGRQYIKIAYENNLISKNDYFYPNRIVTKAELIAILSKLPSIQKKLAKVSSVTSSGLSNIKVEGGR